MSWFNRFLGGPDFAASDRYIDEWLKGMEPGITTATGLRVTVEEALTCPGIAACVQVQSEDIAKVPLVLKRRTEHGYEPATDHPLFNLFKYGPAPWLNSYRWRKATGHGTLAHGNHFNRVWRNGLGVIEKITPVQTGRCDVRWAYDGEPFFDVRTPTGVDRGLTWQDIVHVGYRESTDFAENGGVIGVSPIMQNKETVALMLAAERFASAFFANGAQPSMILEYDKKLPDDDVVKRIRAGIERVYGGIGNKWKVAILELGMKLRETSFDPAKSQLHETRKLGAEIACTMYRTPQHKVGILDKATFSNIEQQAIEYVTGPLSTLAQALDSALTTACLTPMERETLKIETNLEGLMRGDILSRYRAYAIGRQWGWLSVNKILETENQNGIGPDGDQYLVPMNMASPGDDPAKQDLVDDEPKEPGAWMPTDVRWTVPAGFKARSKRTTSPIVGPRGERLYH